MPKGIKIAIFGGTFDPPHPGHLAVIKKLLRETCFDEIWIVPVFSHPFGKKMSPYKKRLELLKTLLATLKNLKIKIVEEEKEIGTTPCFTFDVIQHLKKKFPAHHFTLVVGSDVKKDLPLWHRYKDLKKEVDFYFVKRKGYEKSDLPEISSTEIRNKNIYLTGFMGAGKSRVGRMLAERLSRDFLDTDVEIQNRTGSSIPEIFAKQGETAFRKIETETLKKIARKKNLVVSLGGGAIMSAENRKILDRGLWIFINTPLETMKARALHSQKRPLAQNPEKFEALYRERIPLYQQAHITIDHPGLESDVVCDLVLKRILTNENSHG